MKTNSVKNFFKKYFSANPLSYLGWLGILGVFGIFFIPVLIPFLLCFTFFSYYNMTADELFWNNVHRASMRSFWSVFVLDTTVAVTLFIRGMAIGSQPPYTPLAIQKDIVSMSVFTFDQFFIIFLTFFISITLMLLVFSISMLRFKKQEKKLLEE